MKRRRMNCANPPRFQTRAGTRRRAWGSDSHFGPATCRGEQETARQKRVKFSGSNKEESSSSRDGGCCKNKVDTATRRSDQPKTAEYAFFQKLKEGGSCRFHSHLSHVEINQSEKFECHGDYRESYNVIHGSDTGSHSSMLTENVIAPTFDAFDSKVDTTSKKSGSDMLGALTASPNIFIKLKNMGESNTVPEMKGADGTSDIFSRKRENLLHWLRCTMSAEFEGLSPKGCSIVSLLLKRLSGRFDKDNAYRVPATDQKRADDLKSKSFNFYSDIYQKEFHQKPMKELIEDEVGSSWGSGSSSTWPSGHRERIPPVHDSASFHGFVPWSEMEQMGNISFENNKDIVPYAKSDSALDFPIEECSPASFSCLRNMEEFHHLDRPFLLEGESHTPLLEWNFDRDEGYSLAICPHEDVISDQSQSLDFWVIDHHWSIVKGLGTSRLPALPLDDILYWSTS